MKMDPFSLYNDYKCVCGKMRSVAIQTFVRAIKMVDYNILVATLSTIQIKQFSNANEQLKQLIMPFYDSMQNFFEAKKYNHNLKCNSLNI